MYMLFIYILCKYVLYIAADTKLKYDVHNSS